MRTILLGFLNNMGWLVLKKWGVRKSPLCLQTASNLLLTKWNEKNLELIRKTEDPFRRLVYESRTHNIFHDLERLCLCIYYQNLQQLCPRSTSEESFGSNLRLGLIDQPKNEQGRMWTRPQSLISFFIFIELVKKYRMTGDGGILLLLGPFNEVISRATMSPSYRLFTSRSFMFIIASPGTVE